MNQDPVWVSVKLIREVVPPPPSWSVATVVDPDGSIRKRNVSNADEDMVSVTCWPEVPSKE